MDKDEFNEIGSTNITVTYRILGCLEAEDQAVRRLADDIGGRVEFDVYKTNCRYDEEDGKLVDVSVNVGGPVEFEKAESVERNGKYEYRNAKARESLYS